MSSNSNISITFIGGGNMARSLIGGMIQKGLPADKIKVAEPVAALAEALAKDFSVATFNDNNQAAGNSTIWVFAVKPQVMKSVCQQLAPLAQANKPLIVSIAAGITSEQLDVWLGGNMPVVRIMPNTPALLGAGASGLFANAHVNAEQKRHAQDLMQATGITVWIENENLMDAVTAVSGSGPAYVFLLAEAMQAAGVAQGLSEDAARALTNQTLLGAARMLAETGEPADVLRQRVTSPGGTTQAAIESFEAQGFRGIVNKAIEAATQRGRTLSAAND
ncbi:MAG TPA: pyrroline-5-carboxylate reductase [Arenimonas sp.]|nr:pyrroline-5-carboxylate reductase [Arenimonas sp.]HPO23346.1 pyrroline-5-carboxylate reductase [Arenimonas sp.]